MTKKLFENLKKQFDELGDVFDELKDKKGELEDAIDEISEQAESYGGSFQSIQSLDNIDWRANNLQDINMMEALETAVTKYGSLKIMRILESVV